MRGFYFCEKCNLFIETLTTVLNHAEGKLKITIPFCPHCGKYITEVNPVKYSHKKVKLKLIVFRTYFLRNHLKKVKLRLCFLYDRKNKK